MLCFFLYVSPQKKTYPISSTNRVLLLNEEYTEPGFFLSLGQPRGAWVGGWVRGPQGHGKFLRPFVWEWVNFWAWVVKIPTPPGPPPGSVKRSLHWTPLDQKVFLPHWYVYPPCPRDTSCSHCAFFSTLSRPLNILFQSYQQYEFLVLLAMCKVLAIFLFGVHTRDQASCIGQPIRKGALCFIICQFI